MIRTTSDWHELIARQRAAGIKTVAVDLESLEQLVLLVPAGAAAEVHDVGPLRIDVNERRVWVEGQPVQLTPKEFDILRTMARRRGGLVTFAELGQMVWEFAGIDPNAVKVRIHHVRQKLGIDRDTVGWVQAERGVGFRLVVPQQAAAEPAEVAA